MQTERTIKKNLDHADAMYDNYLSYDEYVDMMVELESELSNELTIEAELAQHENSRMHQAEAEQAMVDALEEDLRLEEMFFQMQIANYEESQAQAQQQVQLGGGEATHAMSN